MTEFFKGGRYLDVYIWPGILLAGIFVTDGPTLVSAVNFKTWCA